MANAEQTATRRMLDQGEKIIIALTEPVDAGSVLEGENYRSRARESWNKLERKKRRAFERKQANFERFGQGLGFPLLCPVKSELRAKNGEKW